MQLHFDIFSQRANNSSRYRPCLQSLYTMQHFVFFGACIIQCFITRTTLDHQLVFKVYLGSHFSSYVVFPSASAFIFFKLNVRPLSWNCHGRCPQCQDLVARPTHLCGSLRGVDGTRDAMFYPGSAPHGGSKSLHPTSLILMMMMITVTRVLYLKSYCLNLTCPTCGTCQSCPLLGSLAPPYICWRGGLHVESYQDQDQSISNTNRIQVQVLTLCKINIPHAFLLKPAHH